LPEAVAAAVARRRRSRRRAGRAAARHEHPPAHAQGDDPLRMQVLAPILSLHTIRHGLLRRAVSVPLEESRRHVGTADADQSYNDKTQIGDIPHQLVITISESPKKKGSSIPAPTTAGCTCRWTMARSGTS
jgi:hypothetical protein